MAELRTYPVNCRISNQGADRLKLLAKTQRKSFGELLDQMILNIPIERADWETAIAQLAARVSALESGRVYSEPEPEPEPITAPAQDSTVKRRHSDLNFLELAALKPIVKNWIDQFNITSKRLPTLAEISGYLWNTHRIGQLSESGQIVALNRAATSNVLRKLGLKDDQ